MEAYSLIIDSITHRASAPRRRIAGGVSGSPRAVGWRQGSLPAPAAGLVATTLLVHAGELPVLQQRAHIKQKLAGLRCRTPTPIPSP